MKPAIYLDNHATTRCDPRVVDAMVPYFSERFGNASSVSHRYGVDAATAVEAARRDVASIIGASPKEIVFTSGTTESVNLALKGLFESNQPRKSHIVTLATEHRAVLDTCEALTLRGASVTVVPVDGVGVVEVAAVEAALTDATLAVVVMAANNEIGTVQRCLVDGTLGAMCRARGVALVCDAAQLVGKLPFDVGTAGVDVAAFSAHKMYGPKGVGALYVRRRPPVRLTAQIDGGGQERTLRAGTLNVPGIVGLGMACLLAATEMPVEAARLSRLRDRLWQGLSGIEAITLNGPGLAGGGVERLPNNLHLSVAHVEGDALLKAIDGVALSSGSACSSARLESSHVLRAIGVPDALAY
ncbi:MAG: cysteine desulfurase, partial [Myxococcota bacterium]